MQANSKELTNVGFQSYVNNLTKPDQMVLKTYVALKFGKSFMTINDKFTGRRQFTPAELLALQAIIEKESWRQ